MITASIVTYNTDVAELLKAIACLRRDDVDHLYIVDNSSEDIIKALTDDDPFISYIPQRNHGYGAGHNVAILMAKERGASYHLVVNADVSWQGKVVGNLVEYMKENPDVGQMMPRIVYPDGSLQYQCKLLPTPVDLLFKRFLPAPLKKKRMSKYQLQFTGYDHVMNVPYLSGCFMMLRMDVLKDIGIFDERFFMYPEDIDMTRRIHEKYKTLYYPELTITHVYAAKSRKNIRLFLIHTVNMIRYFNKWGWWKDEKRSVYNKTLLDAESYVE